ncbi:MAG TPA: hypothetical protein VM580_20005 [Labilithrix sp.]|jgi:hypothetical protein|nr:hypothetical protein [Labilithrix sp.]
MSDAKGIFAALASVLAVVGNVPYLRDVIRRAITPHPYTWFIWSIVSGVTFVGGLVKGAGIGAVPTGVAESFTLVIFLFSLRNGFRGVAKVDHLFLAAALLALISWAITREPTAAVVIVVSIDLIAFAPALRKTWLDPRSEQPILFVANVIRHALTLGALQNYNLATILHSVSMIVTNTAMTLIIVLRRRGGAR